MKALWSSDDAAAATGGTNTRDWAATGVSIDTRSLQPGDLFVALTDQRDGHEFVAEALNKGAGAALVGHVPDGVAKDAPLLIVADVLAALGDLARAARARTSARVVAVTGSVGKTSTKEMLHKILGGQGRTHAAHDSFNNHWGVPLTLARMPAETQFAIIEIGMNHAGEIAPLTALTRPHVALITNVAAVHMAAFDDLASIAREKASIFAALEPGGVAVFQSDPAVSAILAAAAENSGADIVTFGDDPQADFYLENLRAAADVTVVHARLAGDPLLFKINTPGRHFAMNALGALATAKAAGADIAIAAIDIENWTPPAGRGSRETIVLDLVDDHLTLTLLDDAFNASPISMAAALNVLAASHPAQTGRRVAILGDMLELGAHETRLHTDIANLPAMATIDVVHCVGPLMAKLHTRLPAARQGIWFAKATEMAARAHSLVRAGDVILVKGSKGSRVSLVVDAIRKLGHPQAQQLQGTH